MTGLEIRTTKHSHTKITKSKNEKELNRTIINQIKVDRIELRSHCPVKYPFNTQKFTDSKNFKIKIKIHTKRSKYKQNDQNTHKKKSKYTKYTIKPR